MPTVLDVWNIYRELILKKTSVKSQTTEEGRWVH